MYDGSITKIRVFEGQALEASGDATSRAIDLNSYRPLNWLFSVQVTTVGVGSEIKLEYLLSTDGVSFAEPAGATDLITSHGPGTAFVGFATGEPIMARYMKIKATETGGVAAVTSMTVDICFQ